jgi:hypothetical protein
MPNPTQHTSNTEKARKRLFRQYRHLGSYQRLADARGVNVKYVYDFLLHDLVPTNKKIRSALGIHFHHPITINQLLQLPIQDMPIEILRLAFENRMEMT